jgi:thiamine pyrophosphokinase
MVFFMSRAMIFSNGVLTEPAAARRLLRADDFIIAADGGWHNAQAVGVTAQVVIGDFDSLTPAELSVVEKAGALILRYPPEKDETDLELAIAFAVERHFTEIVVVGALGGRLDQTLGNIALLSDVPPEVDIRLDDGRDEVFLVHERLSFNGSPGDTISLIPWGTSADGVTTSNMRYPLNGESLLINKSRGISNEMTGDQAAVRLTHGMLIAVHSRR